MNIYDALREPAQTFQAKACQLEELGFSEMEYTWTSWGQDTRDRRWNHPNCQACIRQDYYTGLYRAVVCGWFVDPSKAEWI